VEATGTYEITKDDTPQQLPIDLDSCKWIIWAGKARVTIHLPCTSATRSHIRGLRTVEVKWPVLHTHLEIIVTDVNSTTIEHKFRTCHLQKDRILREYMPLIHDYYIQLIGTPQDISDKEIHTHINNILQDRHSPMNLITELRTPLPTIEETIEAIQGKLQAADHGKEIGVKATRLAHFSCSCCKGRGCFRECGHGCG